MTGPIGKELVGLDQGVFDDMFLCRLDEVTQIAVTVCLSEVLFVLRTHGQQGLKDTLIHCFSSDVFVIACTIHVVSYRMALPDINPRKPCG